MIHRNSLFSGLSAPVGRIGLASVALFAAACAAGGGDIAVGGSGGALTTSSVTTTTASGTSSSTGSSSSGGQTTSSSSAGGSGSTSSSGTGGAPGFPVGSNCNADSDCASMLCKPVLINSGESVCVTPCMVQADCLGPAYFCDPLTPGATSGYCVPHSPAHCLSCSNNSDCGSLSEECFQAPGDISKACHVDCALSGEDACPPEYTCTDEMVNGMARKLCRPNTAHCLDAIGGFCDRVALPQPCVRDNAAGTCVGQRQCIPVSKRFDVCGAAAPQCKADCSIQDPAGCTETYCSGATSTPANCGMCNNVCPGYMQLNDNVTCQGGMTCTFSCQGENYDVNNNKADGCEKVDNPVGNHTSATATYQGSFPCTDGSSQQNMTGKIESDAQGHASPAITGFNGATGAAPDFFVLDATGGAFCQNDMNLFLQVNGSSSPACYKMTAITNKGTQTCQTGVTGACSITNGSGSYSGGTQITVIVEKTCGTNITEEVTYAVTGHL